MGRHSRTLQYFLYRLGLNYRRGLPTWVWNSPLNHTFMNNDIVYITVEIDGHTLYRSYHKSFFDNIIQVGESVSDMYDTLLDNIEEKRDEKAHDHALDVQI